MGRATSSRSAKRPFSPCPHQLGLPIEGPPPWLPRDSQPFCVTSEGLLIPSGDPKVGCGLWGGLGPSEEGFFVPSQRLTGRKWRVFPRRSSRPAFSRFRVFGQTGTKLAFGACREARTRCDRGKLARAARPSRHGGEKSGVGSVATPVWIRTLPQCPTALCLGFPKP